MSPVNMSAIISEQGFPTSNYLTHQNTQRETAKTHKSNPNPNPGELNTGVKSKF